MFKRGEAKCSCGGFLKDGGNIPVLAFASSPMEMYGNVLALAIDAKATEHTVITSPVQLMEELMVREIQKRKNRLPIRKWTTANTASN